MMKIYYLQALLLFLLISCSPLATPTGTSDKPSQTEIASGLREALAQGATASVAEAGRTDGFLGNSLIRIDWPPDALRAKKLLEDAGFGSVVQDVTRTMNRAAEDASKEALSVLMDAVRQLSFRDVMDILFGEKNAATTYLRRTTSDQLRARFRPIISQAMDKNNVTRYWDTAMTQYNQIPFVQKVNPDLTGHITEKALDGLFHFVEQEERLIRENPIKRGTQLLRKVFGYYDRNK